VHVIVNAVHISYIDPMFMYPAAATMFRVPDLMYRTAPM
jgi:hypothetical protein